MAERYPVIIINNKLPLFFKFPENPQVIDIQSRKLYNQTRTLGGYVYEHWGKEPTVLRVKGWLRKRTSSIFDSEDPADSDSTDPLINTDLFKLRQLYETDRRKIKSIFGLLNGAKRSEVQRKLLSGIDAGLNALGDTTLYYKTTIYRGFFTNFNYSEDGQQPFLNEYNFEFLSTGSSEDFLRNAALKRNSNGTARVISTIGFNLF
jgi:hypothetical protein